MASYWEICPSTALAWLRSRAAESTASASAEPNAASMASATPAYPSLLLCSAFARSSDEAASASAMEETACLEPPAVSPTCPAALLACDSSAEEPLTSACDDSMMDE